MSLTRYLGTAGVAGFPRVSGDEPCCDDVGDKNLTFSPRERG